MKCIECWKQLGVWYKGINCVECMLKAQLTTTSDETNKQRKERLEKEIVELEELAEIARLERRKSILENEIQPHIPNKVWWVEYWMNQPTANRDHPPIDICFWFWH